MTMKRAGLLLAFILPSAGSWSGCSWLFVEPVSQGHIAGDYANCTENPAAPIIDTLFAVSDGAGGIVLYGRHNTGTTGAAIAAGVATGLWLSSAIYGYSKTSECRDANAEAEAGEERRAPRGILRTPPAPQPPVYPQPLRKGAPLLTAPPPPAPSVRHGDDE